MANGLRRAILILSSLFIMKQRASWTVLDKQETLLSAITVSLGMATGSEHMSLPGPRGGSSS